MNSSKVRLYDLAKELKLDTKRLIEDVRREGVDVSVPSNSVSKELADKIRNKYFPKKETVAPRSVRVVKKATRPAGESHPEDEKVHVEHPSVEASAEVDEEAPVAPMPVVQTPPPRPAATPAKPSTATSPSVSKPMVARVIKKLTPAVRAEQPPVQEFATANVHPCQLLQSRRHQHLPRANDENVRSERKKPCVVEQSAAQDPRQCETTGVPDRNWRVPTESARQAKPRPRRLFIRRRRMRVGAADLRGM